MVVSVRCPPPFTQSVWNCYQTYHFLFHLWVFLHLDFHLYLLMSLIVECGQVPSPSCHLLLFEPTHHTWYKAPVDWSYCANTRVHIKTKSFHNVLTSFHLPFNIQSAIFCATMALSHICKEKYLTLTVLTVLCLSDHESKQWSCNGNGGFYMKLADRSKYFDRGFGIFQLETPQYSI